MTWNRNSLSWRLQREPVEGFILAFSDADWPDDADRHGESGNASWVSWKESSASKPRHQPKKRSTVAFDGAETEIV